MANVTFKSPRMPRDVTVYAVAGDRGTLLALAKAHRIPIPFDCQDGECGSCLVEVRHLGSGPQHGIALTEKERELLLQLGKISKDEIRSAEVNDMPPRHRLACQCFVRNEDILVSFEGDDTLPIPAPTPSRAAPIYKGGTDVATLEAFFSYAVRVAEDAATQLELLEGQMLVCGNGDLAALFRQLGGHARRQLEQARDSCPRPVIVELPPGAAWPDNRAPGTSMPWAGDPALTRVGVLKAALEGELRGYAFYADVAKSVANAQIRAAANDFAGAQGECVATLKDWLLKEDGAHI